ncbi:MAG: indole-3-glycerol-phosphate synthase [Nitrososphaerota archaeon]|jgi:indole-3-glycerol phosphate synthase|nr:indole-3-glycerol-phosphate synthase [Nitrososphaerota archaeon]MDG6978740.1 indole-3-glycerol-phosphate synthase [Nitrososphaerota archaeon]MDG7021502.1 indole-3-glycerol-phosphate synthase [Nitrososphaerota archaeon]MDG7022116.1 indole-3-glycerol-phosphate synthase [Nitrososphaerota archaeon]
MRGRSAESSFVFTLASSAAENIERGYYDGLDPGQAEGLGHRSLRGSILGCSHTPVVAEIKFASPSEGRLREPGEVGPIARAYERGGVAAISVLTEPKHFQGDIRYVPMVKRAVGVPVLMKDIVIDPVQIDAGAAMGADAILFIAAVFMNGLARAGLEEMFARARARGLEVLFEAHTREELTLALQSEADVVGINNRDLGTLEVTLETSRRLLDSARALRERLRLAGDRKPVISESGIGTRGDVDEMLSHGADGFLVGSAIMRSADVEAKVRSLTGASR